MSRVISLGTRFTHEPNRRMYRCAKCGAPGVWGEGWVWYGSLKDVDDGMKVPCYCPKCAPKEDSL